MSDKVKALLRQANRGDMEARFALYRERERLGLPKWTISEARENQARLCRDKGYPHFAPPSGRCWSCGKNIYDPNNPRGRDGRAFITGCRYCNRSYCD